ncbi:hypothetical protein HRbin17_02623 [bacterium HR17]|uniref:UPF0102 protein HRbin17_02623 n=1 Tax=Candidatus Fervidibacter japonicus TaxID=2035412 RepID=A0A2H5XFY7_9BACT|nr:hypothetical protein HRbin17_02623 [bacterium HR17]
MNWLTRLRQWWQGRPASPTERGRLAEEAAALYLRRRGYRIVATRVRLRVGEIDLVAVRDKEKVAAFVEVKARSSNTFGAPTEALRPRQRRRLRNAAEVFAARQGWHDYTLRFDLVAVDLDETGRIVHIEHIPDAF